jgi:transcriptional regulator with XRE-family HTH domain
MTTEDQSRHTISEPLRARLKQVRKDAGLSQRALADRIGVSMSTISMVESGSRDPAAGALEAWAAACGAKLEVVVEGPAREGLSVDHLSEQQQQLVADLVKNLPAFGHLLETTLRQLVWIWTAEAGRATRKL